MSLGNKLATYLNINSSYNQIITFRVKIITFKIEMIHNSKSKSLITIITIIMNNLDHYRLLLVGQFHSNVSDKSKIIPIQMTLIILVMKMVN